MWTEDFDSMCFPLSPPGKLPRVVVLQLWHLLPQSWHTVCPEETQKRHSTEGADAEFLEDKAV